jgi:hypothetical protein
MYSYRALVEKLEAIQRGDTLAEAIKLKDVITLIAGTEQDDPARFAKLAQIATTNQLPGLYDPVSSQYVSADGSVASTASKEVDSKLAYMGLIPQGAGTSTWLGKAVGTTGDKYDADLRSRSGNAISAQDLEEKQLSQLGDLAQMIAKFQTMKSPVAVATPVPTGVATAKPLPAAMEGMFARSLVESFGYQLEATASIPGQAAAGVAGYGAAKGIGKVLGKAIPGVGLAFGVSDAYSRAKAGDYIGAGLAGLSGALSLIPGIGWIPALGLDAINVGRDLAGGGDTQSSDEVDSGQGAKSSAPGDSKVLAIQKQILAKDPAGLPRFGADGMMGPETQAAMQKYNIVGESLASSIASLRNRLAMIETASDGADQFTTDDGSATPMMFQKDGKNYALIKGADGEPDQLVDQEGNLIDGSRTDLPIIGKATISESLNESWLSSLFSKFATGAAKASRRFTAGVTNPRQYTTAAGKSAIKPGTPGAGAFKAGQAVGQNPGKTAMRIGAAGVAAGAAMGGSPDNAAGQSAKQSASDKAASDKAASDKAASDKAASDKAASDKALAELRAQIDAIIKELSTTRSPEVKKGLQPLITQWSSVSQ